MCGVCCNEVRYLRNETEGEYREYRHADSLPCEPCLCSASLCWIAPLLLGSSAMASDHLGSSCILALPSVNNVQDDHLSAIQLCLCFLLARGVFGKQGYQCQGKVGCSCVVCVWDVLLWECFPMLLGYPAAVQLWSHHSSSSPDSQTWAFEPLSGLLAAGAAFLQTPECLVAVPSCAAPLSCWLHATLRWP